MIDVNILLDFLNTHKNWEEILSSPPYSLKISHKYNFTMFKYDQLNSDFSLDLVNLCRGIIVAQENDGYHIACWPFERFYNYGESNAANIDWNTAVVSEKVDGSLIKIWNYNNIFYFSTNGMIEAVDAETGNIICPTFQDVINSALGGRPENVYKFTSALSKNRTYMFELVSPITKVVIPYDFFQLYYLGERNNVTGEETFDHKLARELMDFGIKVPAIYPLKSLGDCLKVTAEMPWTQEGFVVRDANFNRVKVKSAAWVMAHHARNNGVINRRHLIEVVLLGESSEFLTYAPEYRELLEDVEVELTDVEGKAEIYAAMVAREYIHGNKKDYAKAVMEKPRWVRDFLFRIWTYPRLTWKDYVSDWDGKKFEKLLDEFES